MAHIDHHGRQHGRTWIRTYRPSVHHALAKRYHRCHDLPRLLPVMATDLAATTREAHTRLVAMLQRALRMERNRGRQGHWTYDPKSMSWARALEQRIA